MKYFSRFPRTIPHQVLEGQLLLLDGAHQKMRLLNRTASLLLLWVWARSTPATAAEAADFLRATLGDHDRETAPDVDVFLSECVNMDLLVAANRLEGCNS